MSCANKNNFTFSFPIRMYIIYFSWLIALAKSFSTMLSRSGKNGHFYLVPNVNEKYLNFLPLS